MDEGLIIPPHRDVEVRGASKLFARAIERLGRGLLYRSEAVHLPNGEFLIKVPYQYDEASRRNLAIEAFVESADMYGRRAPHIGHTIRSGAQPVFSSLAPESSLIGNVFELPLPRGNTFYSHPGFILSTLGLRSDGTPESPMSLADALGNNYQLRVDPGVLRRQMGAWAAANKGSRGVDLDHLMDTGTDLLAPSDVHNFMQSDFLNLPEGLQNLISRRYLNLGVGSHRTVPTGVAYGYSGGNHREGVIGAYLPDGGQVFNAYRRGRQIVQHPDQIIPEVSIYDEIPIDFENAAAGVLPWRGEREPTWITNHLYTLSQ